MNMKARSGPVCLICLAALHERRAIFMMHASIHRLWNAGLRSVRKAWFLIQPRPGHVDVKGRVRFNVSLRCDGLGRIVLGEGVTFGYGMAAKVGNGAIRIQARGRDSLVAIGPETSFSNEVQIFSEKRVSIGSRCLIGDSVMIMDSDFHDLSPEGRHFGPASVEPVVIEDNVFIGSRAIILKGVTIGRDSVIGAGSVVTRSIPPRMVAAGNPAKVLRPL